MSNCFNVHAVSSGDFKLVNYKEEVVIMIEYIKAWDNENNTQEMQIKVVDWMKKRVKNQDIPAVLLLKIAHLLTDPGQSDAVKMQAMFDIIQENKEVRRNIKLIRKMAKTVKKDKLQKQNIKLAQETVVKEKQRVMRLIKDTAIATTVASAIILPALTACEWFIKSYISA